MNTLDGSLSMLKNPAIIKFILQGVLFTLIISVAAVLFSIVIGTVLALMRNYCTGKQTGVLKALSVIYIEVFRNTPLLFWIFICVVFCPAPGFVDRQMFGLSSVNNKLLFKAAVALILYTSGVIAEIVRGGLNSVSHGQIEAGQSQGFSMLQIMWYIVLPQTFRAIVLPIAPNCLEIVITYLSIVGPSCLPSLLQNRSFFHFYSHFLFLQIPYCHGNRKIDHKVNGCSQTKQYKYVRYIY